MRLKANIDLEPGTGEEIRTRLDGGYALNSGSPTILEGSRHDTLWVQTENSPLYWLWRLFLATLVGDNSIDNYWCILNTRTSGRLLRKHKISLSNRDCGAPVPVKILIGMELDVSVDNDTEPSWMKG
ncbi:hypothetical protein pdam_00022528 [Pocillopora damicornis]|uniref:Uncharacterized protein n=1 Tax=Pocillopora damicornis TaxID=46731 RepID=A0A3M6UMQ8_POCDA|nr:hypothetical protein pdam_00022528 [Pocillopora damicornis]